MSSQRRVLLILAGLFRLFAAFGGKPHSGLTPCTWEFLSWPWEFCDGIFEVVGKGSRTSKLQSESVCSRCSRCNSSADLHRKNSDFDPVGNIKIIPHFVGTKPLLFRWLSLWSSLAKVQAPISPNHLQARISIFLYLSILGIFGFYVPMQWQSMTDLLMARGSWWSCLLGKKWRIRMFSMCWQVMTPRVLNVCWD